MNEEGANEMVQCNISSTLPCHHSLECLKVVSKIVTSIGCFLNLFPSISKTISSNFAILGNPGPMNYSCKLICILHVVGELILS